MIVNLFFLILFLALVGVGAWKFYKSSGPLWQRILQSGRNSATIVAQYFVSLVGTGIGGLAALADFIKEPELAAAIQQYLDAKTVSIIMVSTTFITVLARRRTLSP